MTLAAVWATVLLFGVAIILAVLDAWASQTPAAKATVLVVAIAVGALLIGRRVVRRHRRAQRAAEYSRWRAEQDRYLVTADVMSGREFELLVQRLLERDGLLDVVVKGGSADRGADVICRTVAGLRVVVQCKRYALGRKVTSPEMQLFVGMALNEHNADRPLYVTTTDYTAEAIRLARKHGIHLIGRIELGVWMSGAPVFETAVSPSGTRRK